ncbi:Stk1 family PASTA domain-containing Ser/Thr kinase [Longispora albida]|uniref:Stk1 family PASTA domain-containing Ser/Thr kinase n=1 Tax=Longispora albida TaxID=203523 RepID=UPI00037EB6D5
MTEHRLLGGRYQVGDLLGYGGMAEVHRGRDLRLGRDVAIKMLRTDLARDATFQARFRREAQNAASLNHPAIVAVYDTGEERGANGESLPYIVMEFVNGRTLKEVLAVEERLQPRRALEVTADICAALEFSHRHQIIHRDIKPGNVMLTQAGQVKVMDFGIARALSGGTSTMTQTSAVIGTAQYLSPEQARGETVDARSDVYATGCVLYELLTGHPPFTGDNPVSVAYQHVRENPRTPSQLSRDIMPDVDAVVLKALAKNPANRYQSAGEMRADLLRAAAGRPVLATPVLSDDDRTAVFEAQPGSGSPARVADPARRKASTWMIVMLVVLGLVAAGALGTGIYLANRETTVTVPNLVGKTREQALADAEKLGIKLTFGDPVFDKTCVKDQIVRQNPSPQSKVDKDDARATANVCGGRSAEKVPGVVGLDRATAEKNLKALGFAVAVTEVDNDAKAGNVVSSEPAADKEAEYGSTVTLTVSKGNLKIIPPVDGLTGDQAAQRLRDLGFTNVNQVPRSSPVAGKQPGAAIETQPGSGKSAKAGDLITIIVQPTPPPTSSPPTPTPTPSTSGTPTGTATP